MACPRPAPSEPQTPIGTGSSTQLHKAATEGRIASEELEQRVSTVLKARTYAELEATVADLPGPASGPHAGRGLERRAPHDRTPGGLDGAPTTRCCCCSRSRSWPSPLAMVVAVTIIWSVLMVVALALGGHRRIGPAAAGLRPATGDASRCAAAPGRPLGLADPSSPPAGRAIVVARKNHHTL